MIYANRQSRTGLLAAALFLTAVFLPAGAWPAAPVQNGITNAASVKTGITNAAPAKTGITNAVPVLTSITSSGLAVKDDVYTFSGNVKLARGDVKASSETAEYYADSQELHLIGDVYFEDKDAIVHADEAVLDLEDKTGIIWGGNILFKKGNVHVRGEEIDKIGEGRYLVHEGTMTTCDAAVPAWSTSGKDIDINYGGYVRSSSTWFMVKDVPLFYTPYFVESLMVDRASGFLTPTIGFNSFFGLRLQVPYYWAISDNHDATFTADVYSSRAAGMAFQGRYLEPNGIQGVQNIEILNDWVAHTENIVLNGFQTGPNHFFDIHFTSHNDFYELYSLDFQQSVSRFLETKGEVYKDWDTAQLYADARIFEDLQLGDSQEVIFQHLPEVGYVLHPQPIGPFVGDLDSSYVDFWRAEGESVQRLQATPRLSYSTGRAVVFTQNASISPRFYDFADPDQDFETYVGEYNAYLRTRFDKQYANGVIHYIEPTLSYTYKTIYGIMPQQVLDDLEYDTYTSLFTLTVLNRFHDKKGDLVTLSITDSYDMTNKHEPVQPIAVSLAIYRPFYIVANFSYNVYNSTIPSAEIDAKIPIMKKAILTVGEVYQQSPTAYVHRLNLSYQLSRRLSVIGDFQYDTSQGGIQDFQTTVVYKGQCWTLKFTVTKKQHPNSVDASVKVELAGLSGPS